MNKAEIARTVATYEAEQDARNRANPHLANIQTQIRQGLVVEMVAFEKDLTRYWAASRKLERALELLKVGDDSMPVEKARKLWDAMERHAVSTAMACTVNANSTRLATELSLATEQNAVARLERRQARATVASRAGTEQSTSHASAAAASYEKELRIAFRR